MTSNDLFDEIDDDLDLLDEVDLPIEEKVAFSKEIKEAIRQEIARLPIGEIVASIVEKKVSRLDKQNEIKKSLEGSIEKISESLKRDIQRITKEIGEFKEKVKKDYVDVKNDVISLPKYQFGGFAPPNPLNHSGEFLTNSGTWDTIAWSAVNTQVDIGDTVGSGTAGSVLFVDASGNLGQDNSNFFYNNSTDSLFVGVNSGTGKLRLKLDADDFGLYVDGDTTVYAGEQASITVNDFTRSIGDNDGNPVSPTLISAVLTNPYSPSGSQTITNTGILSSPVISGTQNIGTETNYGYRTVLTRSGTLAGSGTLTVNNIGVSTLLTITQTYDSAGLAITETNVGHDITVNATGAGGTHGGLTKNSYGVSLSMTGNAGAGSFMYGFYLSAMSGPDSANMAGLYLVPDVVSYMRGDFAINTNTYSGQFSQVIDTATRTGYFLKGAASQSGNYISVQDSSANTVFTISPNASAAAPTLIVQTLFDSADSVVMRIAGPNRSAAANNDRMSIEFYLDDSNEAQAQFAEIEIAASDVNSASKDAAFMFYGMTGNSLIRYLILGSSGGTLGFHYNDGNGNADFRLDGDNQDNMFFMDASVDHITIGSQVNLALFGIDGFADEIQLLVQGHSTQTGPIFTVETSAGTDVFSVGATTVGFFGVTPATQQGSIADPAGGVVIDAEARTAINSILDVLDAYGLTA